MIGQDPDLVRFDADVHDLTFDSSQLSGLSVAGVGLVFTGKLDIERPSGHRLRYVRIAGADWFLGQQSGAGPRHDCQRHPGRVLHRRRTGRSGRIQRRARRQHCAAIDFSFGIISLSVGGSVYTGDDVNNPTPIGISLQDNPSGSGKLRFAGIGRCSIVGNGKIDAALNATISVGVTFLGHFYGYSQGFGFGSTTLLDLGNNVPFCEQNTVTPMLAKMDGNTPGQLDLLVGARAGERVVPDSSGNPTAGTTVDGNENYTITRLWDDPGGGETLLVSALGVTQTIGGVTSIKEEEKDTHCNIDPRRQSR